MHLFVVRHGESAFNAEGRIQGQSNPPLSELGRKQSQAVAAAFAGKPLEIVYSSPLDRAIETARPVAEELGCPLVTDDGLLELNAGVFQGLTWTEINQRFPDDGAAWKSQNPDFRIPGGESRRDLMRRGQVALAKIREGGQRNVLVVAHGGLLTAALKALMAVPAERNPFSLYNGSISQVDWRTDFKLMTLNQLDHLRRNGEDFCSAAGDL
jgi:broad specificity phosphatase PhoE